MTDAERLTAIEDAMATGRRRVTYGDQTVEYHDLAAMQAYADRLRARIAGSSGASRTRLAVYRGNRD